MPRVKLDDEDFDIDELEEAEYDPDKQYTPYQGAIPPKDTLLGGRVKNMWYTWTQNGDPMFKVIFEVEQPGEYDGLGVWDNVTMNSKSKWRWKPFIDALGIKLIDIKNRMDLEEEENEKLGRKVNRIGKFVPGEDSEMAMILSGRDTRDAKNPKATVAKWMEYDEDAFDEDIEDDEEDDEEEYDEDEEELEDEEDEEEEPPARPTRKAASGKATAKPAVKKSASASASATRTPARTSRGTSARKPRAATPAAKTPTKAAGKRRRPADEDEPPF